MEIDLEKLFEYDEFEIKYNELTIKLKWQDYMSKNKFLTKIKEILNHFEDEPKSIVYDGECVEISYIIFGGVIDFE